MENIAFVQRARTADVSETHDVVEQMIRALPTLAILHATADTAVRAVGTFVRLHHS